ncbi:PBS lyase [Pararobbsia alpina]|uniref:HEAT repeat domain-containing protein n=1 Tax=Pararobbsia alpina TaxID=621374 RepID=UPI0039A4D96E
MNASLFAQVESDGLDPDVVELLPRLESADAATRRVAVLAIADLEDPSAIPVICAVLGRDPDAVVRAEAARVLGSWEVEPAVHALAQALTDRDEAVRHAAADALAQCKDARLGPALVTWLDRPEPFVRAVIFRALRELRYPAVFDAALAAFDDDDANVRVEAVALLGWLRDGRAIAALAHALQVDREAAVRRAASAALGMASIADVLATRALLAALADEDWLVRESTAATLGRIAAASATKDAPASATPGTTPNAPITAAVTQALIASLEDPYWQVRIQAARALGRLRDPSAIAALTIALGHSISNLRKEAALALGEIADPDALPALEQAATDADPEVRKSVRIALDQIAVRLAAIRS